MPYRFFIEIQNLLKFLRTSLQEQFQLRSRRSPGQGILIRKLIFQENRNYIMLALDNLKQLHNQKIRSDLTIEIASLNNQNYRAIIHRCNLHEGQNICFCVTQIIIVTLAKENLQSWMIVIHIINTFGMVQCRLHFTIIRYVNY